MHIYEARIRGSYPVALYEARIRASQLCVARLVIRVLNYKPRIRGVARNEPRHDPRQSTSAPFSPTTPPSSPSLSLSPSFSPTSPSPSSRHRALSPPSVHPSYSSHSSGASYYSYSRLSPLPASACSPYSLHSSYSSYSSYSHSSYSSCSTRSSYSSYSSSPSRSPARSRACSRSPSPDPTLPDLYPALPSLPVPLTSLLPDVPLIRPAPRCPLPDPPCPLVTRFGDWYVSSFHPTTGEAYSWRPALPPTYPLRPRLLRPRHPVLPFPPCLFPTPPLPRTGASAGPSGTDSSPWGPCDASPLSGPVVAGPALTGDPDVLRAERAASVGDDECLPTASDGSPSAAPTTPLSMRDAVLEGWARLKRHMTTRCGWLGHVT